MDDFELRDHIITLLKGDIGDKVHDIEVDVDEGNVSLHGTVSSLVEKVKVEEVISEINDIANIVNDIVVLKMPDIRDEDLAIKIEDAIEDDTRINTNDIDIEVDNGEVIVSGNLHSWEERDAIIHAIYNIRGVTSIVDRMFVEQGGLF